MKSEDDGDLELTLLGQGEQWSQYVVSLYWALQTTLTVGYGDVGAQKETVVMMIFSSLIGISSLLVGTFFTASATVWLSNLDASKRDFTRKLKVLQEFIQTYKHCVPPDLKRRLFLYLDYNQQYNHELNVMEEMLSGMPKQVRTAVKLATTQDLIRKVRLFRDTTPNFISAVVMLLRPSVVLNGDAIFRYGDFGEEMYFLDRGHLHVLIPVPASSGPGPQIYTGPSAAQNGRSGSLQYPSVMPDFMKRLTSKEKKTPQGRRRRALRDSNPLMALTKVASLHSGAYFGEIALFNSESTRTATIQAIVNSTYFALSRPDFEKICPSFPNVALMLRKRASAMVEQNKNTVKGKQDKSPAGSPTKLSKSAQAVIASNKTTVAMAKFQNMAKKATNITRLLAAETTPRRMSAKGVVPTMGAAVASMANAAADAPSTPNGPNTLNGPSTPNGPSAPNGPNTPNGPKGGPSDPPGGSKGGSGSGVSFSDAVGGALGDGILEARQPGDPPTPYPTENGSAGNDRRMSDVSEEDIGEIRMGGAHNTIEAVEGALSALGRIDHDSESEDEAGDWEDSEESFQELSVSKQVIHLCREVLKRQAKERAGESAPTEPFWSLAPLRYRYRVRCSDRRTQNLHITRHMQTRSHSSTHPAPTRGPRGPRCPHSAP